MLEQNVDIKYIQGILVKKKSLKFNHPLPIFDPLLTTDKKIALIIGLGYEEDKALGLYEYFQNDKKERKKERKIYIYLLLEIGNQMNFVKQY